MNKTTSNNKKTLEKPGNYELDGSGKDHHLVEAMKEEIQKIARTPKKEVFPGSQPISFLKEHFNTHFKMQKWLVCEKSDGVRYLMYIDKRNMVYFIDRKYNFHEMCFLGNQNNQLVSTLLDGELIRPSSDSSDFEFYVFDALFCNDISLSTLNLLDRLRFAKISVENFKYLCPANQTPPPPFKIFLKAMYESNATRFLWKEIVPQLKHENDGLIYTKVNATYKEADNIIKWKPKELNTVDFGVEAIRVRDKTTNKEYYRYCQLRHSVSGVLTQAVHEPLLYLSEEKNKELTDKGIRTKIVELSWDDGADSLRFNPVDLSVEVVKGKGGWVFHRVREDKDTANDVSVISNVKRSIANPVEVDELLAFMDYAE